MGSQDSNNSTDDTLVKNHEIYVSNKGTGDSQYGECRTKYGNLVNFSAHPEQVKDVHIFIGNCINTIYLPPRNRSMQHGSYGRYTRYAMKQLKYAGFEYGYGYVEALHIKKAPDNRRQFVLFINVQDRRVFCEFKSKETLEKGYEKYFLFPFDKFEEFSKVKGLMRIVQCGALTPWFYATGEEELVGDYALPWGLTDHPVYRLGQKFIVTGSNQLASIKTCMGTRLVSQEELKSHFASPGVHYVVYWEDGSEWRSYAPDPVLPQPLQMDSWAITEILRQFHQMLIGNETDIVIPFTNNTKFICQVITDDIKYDPAGEYSVSILLKGKTKANTGQVDFTPDEQFPNVASYLEAEAKKAGSEIKKINYIKVIKSKVKKGKKWRGVYYDSPFTK